MPRSARVTPDIVRRNAVHIARPQTGLLVRRRHRTPRAQVRAQTISLLLPSWKSYLRGETCPVIKQALEAFTKKQVAAILLGLRQEREQNITEFLGYMISPEQLERIREVDHL